MSLLHIGGIEYEEGYTGIRKDTGSQPAVQRHGIPHAVFRERESFIFVQCGNRESLSERGRSENRHAEKCDLHGNEKRPGIYVRDEYLSLRAPVHVKS